MGSELMREVADRKVILFVGSGVSAGLGVPTWRGLIDRMAMELGYDSELFLAASTSFMTLAEYYKLQRDSIGPLRSWMDTQWDVSDDELNKSEIHRLIVDLNFPIIYTTNYDRMIERSLKLHGRKCTKIVSVKNITRIQDDGVQVIKFHGDFDDDDSIVLTETDYFRRLSFESPLDVKLRSDALGRSILFIGYSLSDINIRLMLYKLSRAWEDAGHVKYRPPSYVFLSRPEPIQKAVLEQWGVHVLSMDVDNPDDALRAFLEGLLPSRSELASKQA